MIPTVSPGLWDYSEGDYAKRRFKSFPRKAVISILGLESLVQLPEEYPPAPPEIYVLFSLGRSGKDYNVKVLFQFQGYVRGTPVYEAGRRIQKIIFDRIKEEGKEEKEIIND